MKPIYILKSALAAALIAATALSFSGCGKEVALKVRDNSSVTNIKAKTGMTVSEALSNAKIELGSRDIAEPSRIYEITDKTEEIVIRRYAKVKVYKNSSDVTVEVFGGTVEDALDKAGIKVERGEKCDHELSEILEDGMEINVWRESKVIFTLYGEKKTVFTKADTVGAFLVEQNVTPGENDVISKKLTRKIKNNMKLSVKTVEYKEETVKESVPYTTSEQYNPTMYKGERKITRQGVNGEKAVTYRVKYVNGKVKSRKKLSERMVTLAVSEIVTVGTKSPETSSSGSGSRANN